MHKKNHKKLVLNRETLRELTGLQAVFGGVKKDDDLTLTPGCSVDPSCFKDKDTNCW